MRKTGLGIILGLSLSACGSASFPPAGSDPNYQTVPLASLPLSEQCQHEPRDSASKILGLIRDKYGVGDITLERVWGGNRYAFTAKMLDGNIDALFQVTGKESYSYHSLNAQLYRVTDRLGNFAGKDITLDDELSSCLALYEVYALSGWKHSGGGYELLVVPKN